MNNRFENESFIVEIKVFLREPRRDFFIKIINKDDKSEKLIRLLDGSKFQSTLLYKGFDITNRKQEIGKDIYHSDIMTNKIEEVFSWLNDSCNLSEDVVRAKGWLGLLTPKILNEKMVKILNICSKCDFLLEEGKLCRELNISRKILLGCGYWREEDEEFIIDQDFYDEFEKRMTLHEVISDIININPSEIVESSNNERKEAFKGIKSLKGILPKSSLVEYYREKKWELELEESKAPLKRGEK